NKIAMFEWRVCRQKNIPIVGGVGLELLVDDGKQILSSKSLQDFGLVRGDRRGIGIVNIQCVYRRARLSEYFAQSSHIYCPRIAASQIRSMKRILIEGEHPAR